MPTPCEGWALCVSGSMEGDPEGHAMLPLLLALLQPPPQAVPFETPASPDLEAIKRKAEKLPDPPKLDPKNTHKALDPKNTLLLELSADKKPVRVMVACEVCLIRGPLEVFLTRKNTKEHEAILRTELDARLIHGALVAAGAKPGTPARFVDDSTGQAAFKPATGTPVAVGVHYRKDGKLHTHPAGDWVREKEKNKPLGHGWVFAGSRFLKDEGRPDAPPFYTANSGEVVSIANFGDAMLDVPAEISKDNSSLLYEAWTEKIPSLLSGVWVTLQPGK